MTKRLCALFMALVMMLAAAAALADEADELLVTVNGMEIHESDAGLQFWINYLYSQIDDGTEVQPAVINQYAMDYCIRYKLLEEEVNRLGRGLTEEDLAPYVSSAKDTWEEAVTNIMEAVYGITEESSEEDKTAARADAIDYIKTNYGYTEESYTAEEIEYYTLILLSERYTEIVSEDIEVTDDEIQSYFDGLVESDKEAIDGDVGAYEFYTNYYGYDLKYMPEGYRGISHILLEVDGELLTAWEELAERYAEQQNAEAANETQTGDETSETTEEPEATEEPVTEEMVEAAKQAILDSVKDKIDEITAKLESGADFEDLITEYGTDPGMQDEETRKNGYAVHADSIMFDQDFQEGAMKLAAIGDISEPIVTAFGVHILKYMRDIPGGAVELTDEMKEEIKATILDERANEKIGDWINQAMENADCVWTEAGEDWKLSEETMAEAEAAAETEETEAAAE